jgi:hypothetical protein
VIILGLDGAGKTASERARQPVGCPRPASDRAADAARAHQDAVQ